MTWHSDGYALQPGTALEDLDMGAGSMLSVRVSGEQSGGLVTVIEGVIREGGPPVHVHEAEDEVVVVLDGELAYRVGEKQGVLGAGGLLWFPRTVPHAVANLSGRPARFLTVVTPAGIEAFFRVRVNALPLLSPILTTRGASRTPARSVAQVRKSDIRSAIGPTPPPAPCFDPRAHWHTRADFSVRVMS